VCKYSFLYQSFILQEKWNQIFFEIFLFFSHPRLSLSVSSFLSLSLILSASGLFFCAALLVILFIHFPFPWKVTKAGFKNDILILKCGFTWNENTAQGPVTSQSWHHRDAIRQLPGVASAGLEDSRQNVNQNRKRDKKQRCLLFNRNHFPLKIPLYRYFNLEGLTILYIPMPKSQWFWVLIQHPPTEGNLRGGKWNSI
jgi:hypothetical protein